MIKKINIKALKALGKKIIIVGKTASGKTILKNKLIEAGFNAEISYTTRAKREGEVEGVDYYFVSENCFTQMILNGDLLEYNQYEGNFYGTSLKQYRESNVFIMTPSGIDELKPDTLRECYVILVECKESERISRMIDRGWDNDKIQARLKADNSEFADFRKYNVIYNTDK